jgi:DNA-binding response OmpR family regulator
MSVILVIEDDPRIQRALTRQFTAESYEVHIEGEGPAGLAACKRLRPVAVVLDLMLPGLSGRAVCKEIKAWSQDIPVIVLSAITEVADKVLLLETGADDYMTKPFSPRELLARVQAAIRRTWKRVEILPNSFGDVTVDFLKMEVLRAGTPVPLTAHEFKLLRFFIDHPDRVINREELLSDVWGLSLHVTTRTVDNQVLKLRQKLEADPANPVHFRTVHGVGYKFLPQAG